LEDFPHWHEVYTVKSRQWKKGYFYGHFAEGVFKEYEVHISGIQCKCFQVISLLKGPRMSPQRYGRGVTGKVTNCCVTLAVCKSGLTYVSGILIGQNIKETAPIAFLFGFGSNTDFSLYTAKLM